MEIQAVREQMRVLVARPLTGDIRSDVGKVGTVMKVNRRWIEVALDGESSTVPFRATELEPVGKAPESFTEPRIELGR